jgi:hypothetical protein
MAPAYPPTSRDRQWPRVPRLLLPALAAPVLAVLLSATTQAATPALWATVNVCDQPAAPDSMGVRGNMPGTGKRRRMYMRFRAQYWSEAAGSWQKVTGVDVSPWVYAGTARRRSRQAGWTFPFDRPPPGGTFHVRGLVEFQWRARKRRHHRRPRWVVVRRRRTVTRAGIPGVEGADPPGTSLASCLIR